MPVSLNILSLRFSEVPYSLCGTYENLRLKLFNETGMKFTKNLRLKMLSETGMKILVKRYLVKGV